MARKSHEPKSLGTGKWLRLVKDGTWEYVERRKSTAVAVIVAVTEEREMVFVEQYRKPVDAVCIELPAGLAGDIAGEENESLLTAAERELFEETGYHAKSMEILSAGPPSAGLSSEIITFVRAEGLKRKGTGGGDDSEEIQVHVIPLRRVRRWLRSKADEGAMIDPKVWAGLFFAMK